MIITVLGALLGTAQAAEPVLYLGDNPNVAVAQVILATGKGAHEFAPVSVPQLLKDHEPSLLGMGTVETCMEAPTAMSDVSAPIDRAEKAIAYLDSEAGLSDLGAAAEKIACLGEPLVPEVAARLHVLRGVLFHFKGDKPAAWEEYSQAFGFDSEVQWDPNFPPESQKIFELASGEAASSERVTLTVVPGLSDGTLLVDGRPIPGTGRSLDVQPGPHIVQVLSEPVLTLKVTVEPGSPTTLIIPGAVPSDAAAWAADPELQPGLATLTEAFWERDWTYYVVALGGVWKAKVGSGEFEVLTNADERRPMVLTNVPAGSSVIFGLKDGGTKNRVEVPWDEGEIEGSVGLRIASSLSLDAAAPGDYEYTVQHRLLGDFSGEFTVSDGVSGIEEMDWTRAENHARVREAWSSHQEAIGLYEKAGSYRTRARMGQGVAAAGGAIAAYGLARYLVQNGQFSTLDDEVKTLVATGDPDGLASSTAADRDAARDSAGVGLAVLGLGAGVSVSGLGFAQLNSMKGRKGGPEVAPWDPETLTLAEPEVEAPAEEAPAEEAPAEEAPAEEAPAEEAPAEEAPESTSPTIGAPPEAPAEEAAEESEAAEE